MDGPLMSAKSCAAMMKACKLLDTCHIWACTYLLRPCLLCTALPIEELFRAVNEKLRSFDVFAFHNPDASMLSEIKLSMFSTSLLDVFQCFFCICFYISSKNRWQHNISKSRDCAIKHCGH